jgi:predicted PurR-regulated permease PerM
MAIRMDGLFGSKIDAARFITNLNQMVRGFVAGNLIVGSVMALTTTLVLWGVGMRGAIPLGIASGLLNLLPFLGLIASLALPLAAALLQFNTPGPYIVITVTILFLHIVSANLLIPKFIANRLSIGPVAATVGILFWGWLWGVMGLLLAVPLTAFIKLVADLHPSLCHLSNMLALTPVRLHVGCATAKRPWNGLFHTCAPSGKSSCRALTPARTEKSMRTQQVVFGFCAAVAFSLLLDLISWW